MSYSLIYFFRSEKALPDLAAQINAVIGCSLSPSKGLPEQAFIAFPFFGMELDLSMYPLFEDEIYTDDEELQFSLYNYSLDLTTYTGQADARPAKLPVMLSAIHILYRRLGITGMLVWELQKLLALYEERQIDGSPALYDVVSAAPFFRFSDHMNLIERRLPDEWRQAYVTSLLDGPQSAVVP